MPTLPNFSVQEPFDTNGLINAYARGAALNQQAQNINREQNNTNADRSMQTLNMATNLTKQMISDYQQQHENSIMQNASSIMQDTTPTVTDQVTPAGSKLFPGLNQAAVTQPYNQSPQGQSALSASLMQLAPDQFAKAAAQNMYAQPETSAKPVMKTFQRPDGSTGYTMINPDTLQSQEVPGVNAPPSAFNAPPVQLTDADRQPNSTVNQAARMLVEGRATPTTLARLNTQIGQRYIARALELDKDWDSTVPAQRTQMRKDYTSNGAAGKSLTAFNTALAHSDIVDKALDNLDNTQFPAWNTIANKASVQTGDPRVGAFKVARNLFADEMAKAAQGGTGIITEDERQRQLQSFDDASSPAQMKAAVDTAIQLMASKSKVLKDNWENSMAGSKPAIPFVTSQAAKVLKSRGYSPNTLEQEANPNENPGVDLSKFWK